MRDFTWLLRRHEHDIRGYCRLPIDNGTVTLPERNLRPTVSAKTDAARGEGGVYIVVAVETTRTSSMVGAQQTLVLGLVFCTMMTVSVWVAVKT